MANYTLTYSESSKGFPSFYSFYPDFMIGMNNYLYSFNKGQLYRHNTNATRNKFYNVVAPSQISTVINEQPLESKVFKTIGLESTDAWSTEMLTDVASQSSSIANTSFIKKEGNYFAYVRTNGVTGGGALTESDFKSRANGGVGVINSLVGGGSVTDLRFDSSLEISNQLSIGDSIYAGSGTTLSFAGVVTAVSNGDTIATNYIRLNNTGGTAPSVGHFVMYFKNAQAESLGVMGHYAEIVLTLPASVTTASELFAVECDVIKSYP